MRKELNKDCELWKSFKEGNDEAFFKLYDQNVDMLYHFGSHFSKDKDFIKDCIHDLFLDLYKYRHKLSETDNVQFYLLRSFRRKIHREQVKIIPIVYDEKLHRASASVLAFEDALIESETEDEHFLRLRKAMKKLTDRQREGLSLKFEHNLSYAEIAEIQGMSIESARTGIYRALKTLRKCIQEEMSSINLFVFIYKCLDKLGFRKQQHSIPQNS